MDDAAAEVFERYRPLLFSIAYRMLGGVADAEDVVQGAYLRWRREADAPEAEVRSPKAYLSAVVTRLSIDRLRQAKARREEYVGPWLPEPLLAEPEDAPTPAGAAELEESLSIAFLVLLESLNPTERAVFLLREVFGYGYGEIARIVGKGEANARQIAHRARSAVAARRPRFDPSPEQGKRLTERFLEASRSGDMGGLLELLADDVTVWSDGGGKATAARRPVRGKERVARFFLGLAGKAGPGLVVRIARVNGGPGAVVYSERRPAMVLSLDVEGELVRVVRVVVNPDKLGSVPPLR
jgi:RNA polymerase sigma-70 factor, ECF subfamily